MKGQIFNWCYAAQAAEVLQELGLENGDIVTEPFEVAESLFHAGLDVMLTRNAGGIIIGIDTKKFRQR
jgi:hypothetical protein